MSILTGIILTNIPRDGAGFLRTLNRLSTVLLLSLWHTIQTGIAPL